MEKKYLKNQFLVEGNPIDPRQCVDNIEELEKYTLYDGLIFYDKSEKNLNYIGDEKKKFQIPSIDDVSSMIDSKLELLPKSKNGLTPYIGDDGNWWIGTTDTGHKATIYPFNGIKIDNECVVFHHKRLDKDVSISWEQIYDLIKKEN